MDVGVCLVYRWKRGAVSGCVGTLLDCVRLCWIYISWTDTEQAQRRILSHNVFYVTYLHVVERRIVIVICLICERFRVEESWRDRERGVRKRMGKGTCHEVSPAGQARNHIGNKNVHDIDRIFGHCAQARWFIMCF